MPLNKYKKLVFYERFPDYGSGGIGESEIKIEKLTDIKGVYTFLQKIAQKTRFEVDNTTFPDKVHTMPIKPGYGVTEPPILTNEHKSVIKYVKLFFHNLQREMKTVAFDSFLLNSNIDQLADINPEVVKNFKHIESVILLNTLKPLYIQNFNLPKDYSPKELLEKMLNDIENEIYVFDKTKQKKSPLTELAQLRKETICMTLKSIINGNSYNWSEPITIDNVCILYYILSGTELFIEKQGGGYNLQTIKSQVNMPNSSKPSKILLRSAPDDISGDFHYSKDGTTKVDSHVHIEVGRSLNMHLALKY